MFVFRLGDTAVMYGRSPHGPAHFNNPAGHVTETIEAVFDTLSGETAAVCAAFGLSEARLCSWLRAATVWCISLI